MPLKHLLAAAALAGGVVAAAAAPAPVAVAQAADPAAQTIDRFDAALLDTMKQGQALGPDGRYRKLEPAVQQAFDLPLMTQFAVGPKWATLAPADQAALVKAFTHLNVASYAHNFDSYDGERFTVGKVDTRGPDKLVHSQIISSKGKPTDLAYRMRQSAGGPWKIIDVYYNGSISELTTRRSDFSGTINAGGAPALLKKIDALADKLMK